MNISDHRTLLCTTFHDLYQKARNHALGRSAAHGRAAALAARGHGRPRAAGGECEYTQLSDPPGSGPEKITVVIPNGTIRDDALLEPPDMPKKRRSGPGALLLGVREGGQDVLV